MEQDKYLTSYIEQLTKSVKLYNKIYAITSNHLCQINRHYPIDWDNDDVFEALEYLYDYILPSSLLNFNSDDDRIIKNIMKNNINELSNTIIINKLKEVQNKYKSCINILEKSTISYKNTEIYLPNIITYIDHMIEFPYEEKLLITSRKYIEYTDNDIKIIKECVIKIRNELLDIANNLKLPDKQDWEVKN